MHAISVSAMRATEPVIHVRMAYDDFVRRFGPAHSTHPPDWDAPGLVELWFFELPWGHRILLQFHLGKAFFHIYLECLETEAVLEHLGLNRVAHERMPYFISLLQDHWTEPIDAAD